jgi:CRP/FNR family transcriptional regulator, dissimilatory nitrate respiration regulator
MRMAYRVGDENLTMRAARPTVRPPEALPLLPDAVSMVRRLATGEVLFKQGDRAAIYKVESGRLRLIRRTVDDHLVVLHTARSGEFFAEASLFSEIYHCDAIAAVASDVRVYAKATLLASLRTEPAFSEAFMARLAHQVQELRARMELRNIRSARERVLQYLLLRAGADGRTITIEGQLQDIAAEVGLTREALYRALAGLEAEGVLARVGSVMVLRKSDRA